MPEKRILCLSLKYEKRVKLLPIGGLLSIKQAPVYSDQLIALKQNRKMLLSISYAASQRSCSSIILECVHIIHLVDKHVYMHAVACKYGTYILLDYTSYSQANWRYIRYLLGGAATYIHVKQDAVLSVSGQVLASEMLYRLKSTFTMLLQLYYTSISTYSSICRLFSFMRHILRSRTQHNTLAFDDASIEPATAVCQPEEDVDEEYKAEQDALAEDQNILEQQISIAGIVYADVAIGMHHVSRIVDYNYIAWHLNLYSLLLYVCSFAYVCIYNMFCYIWLSLALHNLVYKYLSAGHITKFEYVLDSNSASASTDNRVSVDIAAYCSAVTYSVIELTTTEQMFSLPFTITAFQQFSIFDGCAT